MKRILYYELVPPGDRITKKLYQQQLIYLSDAIEEKEPFTGQKLLKEILLIDNARPHTKNRKKSSSPNLAPSDYH